MDAELQGKKIAFLVREPECVEVEFRELRLWAFSGVRCSQVEEAFLVPSLGK
jgi:hypothetical protein